MEGGEYIAADDFPHLVRNCQNANNVDAAEADDGANNQDK